MSDGAQVHTLEAFAAGFVVLFAALLTVQSMAAYSTDTSGEEVKLQTERWSEDILMQSNADGEIKDPILNWTGENEGFNRSIKNGTYYSGTEMSVPDDFGESLSVLREKGVAYNIYIECNGAKHPFVRNGEPGRNPVTASVTIALGDHDELADGTDLVNSPSYPCADADGSSDLYNVVRLRMVSWKG